MKEKKETPYYFKLNVLIWILIGSLFTLIGFGLALFPVNNDVHASIVANAIQFATLVFTVASFLYLIKNFQQQKEQIEENRKDVVYGRSLDVIYRQIENNKGKLDSVNNHLTGLVRHYDNYNDLIGFLDSYRNVVLTFLNINHIVEQFLLQSKLDAKSRTLLYSVYYDNLPQELPLTCQKIRHDIQLTGNNENEQWRHFRRVLFIFFRSRTFPITTNVQISQAELYRRNIETMQQIQDNLSNAVEVFKDVNKASNSILTTMDRLRDENYVTYQPVGQYINV